jgi:LysM repeat protein
VGHDANVGYVFIPWARSGEHVPTRDAAPSATTIKGHANQQLSLEKIVGAMREVDQRLSALEAKRSLIARQQEMFQRQMTMQATQPSQPTQDRAPPCACQHQPAPQAPYRDGVTHMDRDPRLAPRPYTTEGFFPRHGAPRQTRDNATYGEQKQPFRFGSEFVEKAAGYLPSGSAGRTSTKEAVNDIGLRALRDAMQSHNVSGGPGSMAAPSDGSSGFASELDKIPTGASPQTALNCFNRAYHAAKTSDARDRIERVFRDWQAAHDGRDGNPWRPRQAEARDAPAWQGLYESNKGTIGSNPNMIREGSTLQMPGGGEHVVQKGESLSSIASGASSNAYAGSPSNTETGMGGMKGGPTSLLGGGGEPSGGSYSSNSSLKVSEGTGVPGTKLPTTLMGGGGEPSSSTPTSSPSGGSGSAQAATPSSSSVPMPPVKPASLGGTGESPSGMSSLAEERGGTSPSGGEGTGLAKMVRGWVQGTGDAKKPRGK